MSLQYDPTLAESNYTFRAVTDNSGTSGSCALQSDITYAQTQTHVRLPTDMKMVIKAAHAMSVAQATQFTIDVSHDGGSTWVELKRAYVASNTEEATPLVVPDSPIVIRNMTGAERVRIGWSQSVAALAYLTFVFELAPMAKDE